MRELPHTKSKIVVWAFYPETNTEANLQQRRR
jgi:hypothetical protein